MPISVLETQLQLHLGSCSPGAQQGVVGKFRQGHSFLPGQGILILEGEPQTGIGERAGLVRRAERLPGGEAACEKTLGIGDCGPFGEASEWRQIPSSLACWLRTAKRGGGWSLQLSVFSSSHALSLIGRLPNRA